MVTTLADSSPSNFGNVVEPLDKLDPMVDKVCAATYPATLLQVFLAKFDQNTNSM